MSALPLLKTEECLGEPGSRACTTFYRKCAESALPKEHRTPGLICFKCVSLRHIDAPVTVTSTEEE